MKLYGAPNPAPNPRRVRIFLAEKGIELPETPISLMTGEHKSPEHIARNSRGQVPTLVLDDGVAISETVSICRYFEELHPEPCLFGATPIEFNLMAPVGNFWRHAHPRTAALLTQFKDFGESNRAAYASVLKWLDGELADRPFLAGQTYTMADICALTTIDFASWIGLAMEGDIPNVTAWHARVTARPSAQA